MDGGRWTVDGGQWTADSGSWTVDGEGEQWMVDSVDSEWWTVGGGWWTVDGGQYRWTVNGGDGGRRIQWRVLTVRIDDHVFMGIFDPAFQI